VSRPVPVPAADGKPSACPDCGSADVKTASKTIDASTYWNCTACGEVWNVSRRAPTNRAGGRRW
jgi:ribosomal protein L37AE/L43A